MSATTPAGSPSGTGAAADDRSYCTGCGARMDADQEWCLECGLARTSIQSPPDWRVPLAVIGVVVIGALTAFAIAIINLTGGGSSPAPAPVHTTAAVQAAANPSVSLLTWPAGLPGWTVVLDRSPSQGSADATALNLVARGVPGVGVLDSSDHPHLQPGYYVVFAGRYPTLALAQAAATRLVHAGQRQALAHEIAAPGGI
jgi:hypothetical protein